MPWCPECGAEYREGFARCSECGVALVNEPPPETEQLPEPGPEWVEVAGYTTVEEARLARVCWRSRASRPSRRQARRSQPVPSG